MFKIRKKKSLTIPNNVIKITPFILINKQHCIFVSFLYLPDFTGTHPQQYFPLVNGMFFNQKKRDKLFLSLSQKQSSFNYRNNNNTESKLFFSFPRHGPILLDYIQAYTCLS